MKTISSIKTYPGSMTIFMVDGGSCILDYNHYAGDTTEEDARECLETSRPEFTPEDIDLIIEEMKCKEWITY